MTAVFSHPATVLLAAALAALVTRGWVRKAVLLAAPVWALRAAAGLGSDAVWTHSTAGFTLELLRVDALSRLFAVVFCIVTLLSVLYGLHLKKRGEPAASVALAGASLGVVFAGDWLSLFVFWELMTVASLFVIWFAGTPGAHRAGFRYLLVHVFGGGLFFCGLLLHWAGGGDAAVGPLTGAPLSAAGWLILTGVAVNAAIPPLHAWLTDAYPECSVTGSVVQSAFTTKTAVYVLLRVFPGAEPLVVLGAVMALYGVVYAVLADDIRRLLAYHIVSQVGFMVAGVGMGTALSMNGAAAHAFCHILYKALLFMGAGAIVHAAGTGKLSELGGLWRRLPLVMTLFLVGAFSISGLPPLSGFISKGMTVAAAGASHRPAIELLLELASVGTFLSIGLKLAYFAFAGTERSIECRPVPNNMVAAMVATAALCAILGIFPRLLYALLPYHADYHPYTAGHVLGALQLHLGTAAGFWMLLKLLSPKPGIALDVDWLYRVPLPAAVRALAGGMKELGGAVQRRGVGFVYDAIPSDYDVDGRRLPVGMTLFWITLLVSLLALYAWV
ncbi:MAG: Na(+)/H(+) antiporter subunit D [Elusimicrobiota bacterium]